MEKLRKKVLVPLFDSPYFRFLYGDNLKISKEQIATEEVDGENNLNRISGRSIIKMFLGQSLNVEEERDIFPQPYKCIIPNYPIESLFNLINKDWDVLCLTQRQIKAFCHNYGKGILTAFSRGEDAEFDHLLFLAKEDELYFIVKAKLKANSSSEFEYGVIGHNHYKINSKAILVMAIGGSKSIYENREEDNEI